VSKQIGLLEEELGLTDLRTQRQAPDRNHPPGRVVLAMAQRMLAEAQNMKRVGEDYAAESSGTLSIATTHTQARYTLPPVIRRFVQRHPSIRLHIQQGSPLPGGGLGARRQRRHRHRHRGAGPARGTADPALLPVVASGGDAKGTSAACSASR
jgi:hypothetical protein